MLNPNKFAAIPSLKNQNTTLSLMFAAFSGAFDGPSDDLLFPAHIPLMMYSFNGTVYPKSANTTGVNGTDSLLLYGPDNTVSVLACIEQVQICAPSSSSNPPYSSSPTSESCTPFQSFDEINNADLGDLFENHRQRKIAHALIPLLSWSTFGEVTWNAQLLAESFVYNWITSTALPPDQWILESQNLFRIGLAVTQRSMVEYISGRPEPYSDSVPKNQFNNDTELDWLCRSQIIRRNDYLNFSTLNLWLVVGIGFVIIVLSLWLETLVEWLEGKGRWRMRAWWAEGILQLQKAAFEGRGIEGWEDSFWDSVPVMESGRTFLSGENLRVVFPKEDVEEETKEEPSEALKSNSDEEYAVSVEVVRVDSFPSDESV